jgi:hypothetical protein
MFGWLKKPCHKNEEITLSYLEELLVDGKDVCKTCAQTYTVRVFPEELNHNGFVK